ncbi:unnamed protein product [Caenorhabditis nigoni]
MANLNQLHVYLDGSPYNLKLEDLLLLNVKTFIIMINEFSVRDLNRFFKMWIKGSNPKLEYLEIYGHFERFPDWNVLLNGLKAVEEEEEGPKEAEAVEEPEDAQDDENQEDDEELEDEDEEEEELEGESEGEDVAGEADEPYVGRVKAVEAQNEPEGEAQEVRIEEAEAVAEEVPVDVQEEEVQEGYDDEGGKGKVAEESEENEDDEEYEEEEDEEDIEDDNDYEDEGSELEDETEYEDEEEPEEAQIVPVAQVPRVAQRAENTAVVKTYTIRNSLGIFAEIETEFNRSAYVNVGLKFTVFH